MITAWLIELLCNATPGRPSYRLKNYASLAFTAALRHGRAKIISKKSKHDKSTTFALRRHNEEFINEDRSGLHVSAEFGSNWNPHPFID
jgi:hypothetical protein